MSEWDYQLFDEKLGNKVDYGVMVGKPLSGKTTLAKVFKDDMDYTVIDMKVLAEICKKKLGTDDEPFEGEVGIDKI
jgi:broad-specificity NMP kinase